MTQASIELTFFNLTANALFYEIDIVLATKREIRRMHFLLNRLMTILQHQSKKSLFSSKVSWFDNIALVRKWQTELKLIAIPRVILHFCVL